MGRVRALNEDRGCVRPDLGLAALADGMGGHHAGDVAASLAIATLVERLERAVGSGAAQPLASAPQAPAGPQSGASVDLDSPSAATATAGAASASRARLAWWRRALAGLRAGGRRPPEDWLGRAVIQANRKVFSAGDRKDAYSMGTTLVAIWSTDGGVHWANVGDSRLYRWSAGEGLAQVSRDHSLVAEYLAAGLLTPAQARDFPYRNIIVRGIGLRATVRVDQGRLDPRPGDRYLLCSDGLTDLVADEVIAPLLASGDDPQTSAEALVALALGAGGTDNVTAIVIHVHAEDS